MKKYDVVAFDLDGTLTNPERGLVASFSYGLSKMGIDVSDKEFLKRFIGPPLHDAWQEVYGFTPEEAREAVRLFREFFSVYGWWDNELYEGIPEMLATLKNRGKYIVLTTSKPEVFAKRILERFDLAKYFDFVAGATLDESRNKKGDVIRYALDLAGVEDLSEVIMIGDREHDIIGAKQNKIDSIGVLWGYGDLLELEKAGPTYIAEKVLDLLEIIK